MKVGTTTDSTAITGSIKPVWLIIREHAQSLVITADKIMNKGVRWSYWPPPLLAAELLSQVAGTGPSPWIGPTVMLPLARQAD